MAKSRGFTLTEIIAVVVILGVLIGIATPIYITVSQNTRKNNYNAKVEYLKSKAIAYANENNIDSATTINAFSLIYAGYVAPDYYEQKDGYEEPHITNPINDTENLACRLIDITFVDNDINATVSDSSVCDLDNVETETESLGVNLYGIENGRVKNSVLINHNVADWSNKDVLLVANPTGDVKKVMITKNGETKVIDNFKDNDEKLTNVTASTDVSGETVNSVIFTTQGTLSTDVTITVQYTDTIKVRKIKIQVDKEAPIAIVESYGGWQGIEYKGASVFLNDGNGSGPKGVYLTNSNKFDKNNAEFYSSVDNNIATVSPKNNGIYYLWTVDEADNIAILPTELYINSVDVVGPDCLIPSYPSNWINHPITLGWGCKNDSESGCKTRPTSRTWDQDGVFREIINFQIEDYVANKRSCTLDINTIKIDQLPPLCSDIFPSYTPNANGWFNKNVELIYGCGTDDTSRTKYVSGCDSLDNSQLFSVDGIYKDIQYNWTINDEAQNFRDCNSTYKELKLDKTAPVLSKVAIKSNMSGYNSNNVKLTITATDNLSGVGELCVTTGTLNNCKWISVKAGKNSSYSASTVLPFEDGSGKTLTLKVYARDLAYNVSNVKVVSYTLYNLCDKTKWQNDTGCSKDCGGGTLKRHKVDQFFDSKTCGPKEDASCNNHDCPPPPSPGGGDEEAKCPDYSWDDACRTHGNGVCSPSQEFLGCVGCSSGSCKPGVDY